MSEQVSGIISSISGVCHDISSLLTAIAGLITAIAGLITAILSIRTIHHKIFGSKGSSAQIDAHDKSDDATQTEPSPTAGDGTTSQSDHRKHIARTSLLVFVVSAVATLWLALFSAWGVHLSVAGLGAVVAAAVCTASAAAFVFFELIRPRSSGIVRISCLVFALLVGGMACGLAFGAYLAEVSFTQVPPIGEGDPVKMAPISGRVSGVVPADVQVFVYAHTNLWYVQPGINKPIGVSPDGTWTSETHPGDKYAVLLVKKGYRTENITEVLPGIGSDVLSLATFPPLRK